SLQCSARPLFRCRTVAQFAARRLSILPAWQLDRRCPPRRLLSRSQSRPRRQVLISRPVPPRSVLPRHLPNRRRRRLLRRQVLLLFLASVTFSRMLNEDRQGGSSASSGDVKINPA